MAIEPVGGFLGKKVLGTAVKPTPYIISEVQAANERQIGISPPMSAEPTRELRPMPSEDQYERIMFGLEVASNDPAVSERTRANAERLLRIQRLLAGARSKRS